MRLLCRIYKGREIVWTLWSRPWWRANRVGHVQRLKSLSEALKVVDLVRCLLQVEGDISEPRGRADELRKCIPSAKGPLSGPSTRSAIRCER